MADYKREVWDGSDLADWYQDYYKALEKYIKYLENKMLSADIEPVTKD